MDVWSESSCCVDAATPLRLRRSRAGTRAWPSRAILRALVAVVIVLAPALASAGMLPEPTRRELIAIALANFWGHARTADGKPIEPASEAERRTVPISDAIANQVIDVGEISALAEWCGADWQAHYLSLTAAARAARLTEKQVAFIGVLHGLIMGGLGSTLRARPCEAAEREQVLELMRQSPNKTIKP
jgi:hypothetical protein